MKDTEYLLERVRAFFATRTDVAEQRSIGGSRTFTVVGNMCCGVGKKGLMVRVGPERYEWALAQAHVRPLEMGSKRPLGYVWIEPAALDDDAAFERWMTTALRFVLTLPAKARPAPAARKTARRRSSA